MKCVLALTLSGMVLAHLYAAAPTKPSSTKATVTKAASSAINSKAHAAKASTPHSITASSKHPATHLVAASRTSSRPVTVSTTTRGHYVKGKYVKGRAVTHAAPAPSYQLQPDPERYQEIQRALADRGYYKGEVNGEWDADSVDALTRFQTDQNLNNDGKISALSLIALGLGPKHLGSSAVVPNVPVPGATPASTTATPTAGAPATQPPSAL